MSGFLHWLTTDSAKRYPLPGLVAYHWAGGAPKACSVGNISATGMYIFTDDRWLRGSVIPMTLQRVSTTGRNAEDWIAVLSRVVRSGPDGFGIAFVFSRSTKLFGDVIPPERLADNKALRRFLKHVKRNRRG